MASRAYCLSSNISRILRLNGILLGPEVVFGLCGSITTHIWVDSSNAHPFISGVKPGFVQALCELAANAGPVLEPCACCPLVEEDNREVVLPMLCAVDDFGLSYSINHAVRHQLRLVVLESRNGNNVSVFDETHREVGLTQWRLAASDVAYRVKPSEYKLSFEGISRALVNACSSLYAFPSATGLGGEGGRVLRFLESEIARVRGVSVEERPDQLKRLHYELNRNGGLSCSRYLFSGFLRWIGEVYCIEGAVLLAEKFAAISKRWEAVGNACFRLALAERQDPYFARLLSLADATEKIEQGAFGELLAESSGWFGTQAGVRSD
jgi:hypothetical protein